MNRILLRAGGAINLLFVVFHLGMVKPIGEALAPVSPDIRATVSTLNISMAFALLIFGYLAVFRWRDLLTTRLGNTTAIAISLFWFLRAITQVVFYGLTARGVPLIVLCLVVGLAYLIPVGRAWKDVLPAAQHRPETQADRAYEAPGWIQSTRWPSYAVVAWCVVFGGLHLYWALGGTAGFVEFSMPSNRTLALTRDPLYMAITWGVVIACVVGAVVALAPFQQWSRRLPRWVLLAPLWIACGLFLVRGIGNPVQSALIIAGGMPFDALTGTEMHAWNEWLLIDAICYSPWFVLGGLAFGATAWSARLRAADAGRRELPGGGLR